MWWTYALENYSFLAIAYGKYQIWVALVGFLLLLGLTRWCCRYSAIVMFRTWLMLWCWLLLPLAAMVLPQLSFPGSSDLWARVSGALPEIVSGPCNVPFYGRFSEAVFASTSWLTWHLLITLLWALIALALAARGYRQYQHLRRLARTMRSVLDPEVLMAFERWRLCFGIRRRVRLCRSNQCSHPFTFGIWRPVVYVPDFLLDELSPTDLDAVLGHELAHVKRFDAFWLFVQLVIQAMFFFNPLVWLAHRRITLLRERCCDKLTIRHGKLSAKDYSHALVRVLELRRQIVQPLPVLSFGASTDALRQRIKSLLAPPPSESPLPLIFATCGLLATAMIVLTLTSATTPTGDGVRPARVLVSPLPGARLTLGFNLIESGSCGMPKVSSRRTGHNGIDLLPTDNHRVAAVADGQVVGVEHLPGALGSLIRIGHDNSLVSIYVHVSDVRVAKGEHVRTGQTIADMPTTSAIRYLHFELHHNGQPVDPEDWLRRL